MYLLTCIPAVLNNTPGIANSGRKKTKKDYIKSEVYVIDEVEDIIASADCSCLIIRRERLLGDLANYKDLKRIMWQLVACAHSTRHPAILVAALKFYRLQYLQS